MPQRPPPKCQLTISEYSRDGFGLGYFTGQTGSYAAEVPFTMPGDEVLASLIRRRRGVYQSRLEEIVHPAADRIEPRCRHFGQCGGCRWQHVPYDKQLAIKESTVRHKFDSLTHSETKILPILGCEPPWNYRNKMEFSFSEDSKGSKYLGLNMQGGRGKVFELLECHLVDPWMPQAVATTRLWWQSSPLSAYHMRKDTGTLRTLTLRHGVRTDDRMAILTVSGRPESAPPRRCLDDWVKAMQESIVPAGGNLSLFVRIHQIRKGKPTQFYEMHLAGPDHIQEVLNIEAVEGAGERALRFTVGPTAFFQPNPRQAERLYSQALQMARLHSDMVVYDLCCGTGTLGIAAAPYVKEVIGIELAPESVLDARANAQANGCSNVSIYAGDVGDVLDLLRLKGIPAPTLVMVDPPRAGLDAKTLNHLKNLQADQILYISCNPDTQAKNAVDILASGYRLDALLPVDQFPQTIHVENIALFKRVMP